MFPFHFQVSRSKGPFPAAAVLWPNGAWSQIPRWHHVPRHPTKCLGHRDASENTFEGEAETWTSADFEEILWTVKMNIHLKDLFRTYLWSILNSNYVMITLWRLTRKPSQTIVFRCFFPGGVVPVRSKRIGIGSHGPSATKFICQPRIVSKHLSCETTLGFYETNFCWVDVSLVKFPTPLLNSLFPWFEFSSSKHPWWIRHLQNRWTLKAARPFL